MERACLKEVEENLPRTKIHSIVALLLLGASHIHALCQAQREDGVWVNIEKNTRSITKVILKATCDDTHSGGPISTTPPPPPPPPWWVEVFGSCHPTDCVWGRVGGKRIQKGYIFATYNFSFAKKTFFAWMEPGSFGDGKDVLQTYTWTDFIDPSRNDYASWDYFIKENSISMLSDVEKHSKSNLPPELNRFLDETAQANDASVGNNKGKGEKSGQEKDFSIPKDPSPPKW